MTFMLVRYWLFFATLFAHAYIIPQCQLEAPQQLQQQFRGLEVQWDH